MQPKILFVHNHLTSFVKIDRDLLAERYRVFEWFQRGRVVNLAALAQQVRQSDVVFGWFASWHTFFPVLLARFLGKPTILVVGGYDTANMPEINYGSMRGGFKRLVARVTMHSATALITHSNFSRAEVIRNVGVDAKNVTTVYLGLPLPSKFDPNLPKQNLAVTVGNVDQVNLQRKGLESFVRSAAFLPDTQFLVIGAWRDESIEKLKRLAPPNVKFTGRVSDAELESHLSRASVYVQASQHEGFGMAVAEAMLCECIPVVTRVGSLPEVVSDFGVYAESADPEILAAAIQRALNLGRVYGEHARAHVMEQFAIGRRQQRLYTLIEHVSHDFE